VTSLFVKAYLNCLLPESLEYLELSEESLGRLQRSVEKIDLFRVGEIKKVEELFDYLI